MDGFTRNIEPFVKRELERARLAESEDPASAFRHLERAHVLGQESTRHHVRSHVAMLGWAVRQRDRKEVIGQLLRIVGAATKTAIGLVPEGNTGGSNVSPFRRQPIPADLRAQITAAHN